MIRSIRYLVLAAAMLSVSVLTAAEVYPFSNIELKVSASLMPLYRIDNIGNNQPTGGSRNQWMLFQATFVPRMPSRGVAWLDNVKVVIEAMADTNITGKTQKVIFSGEELYWSVRMDGEKHRVLMAIPPKLLDRYITPGIAIRPGLFSGKISFYAGSTLLGAGYTQNTARAQKQLFETAQKAKSANLIRVRGGILQRSRTPWAFIENDFYEVTKEESK